jgi:hypothetical protein
VIQKKQPRPAKAEIAVKEDDFKAPVSTSEPAAPARVAPAILAAGQSAQPSFAQLLSTSDQ